MLVLDWLTLSSQTLGLTLLNGGQLGIHTGSMEALFHDFQCVRPTFLSSTPHIYTELYQGYRAERQLLKSSGCDSLFPKAAAMAVSSLAVAPTTPRGCQLHPMLILMIALDGFFSDPFCSSMAGHELSRKGEGVRGDKQQKEFSKYEPWRSLLGGGMGDIPKN